MTSNGSQCLIVALHNLKVKTIKLALFLHSDIEMSKLLQLYLGRYSGNTTWLAVVIFGKK